MFRNFVVVSVISLSFLNACGPEKTAVERDREQYERTTQENVRQKTQELQPLVGKYWGQIRYATTGRTEMISLELYIATQIVTNPNRNETTEIPILAGSLKAYETQDRSSDSIIAIYSFTQSKWNPKTNKLILFSDNQSAEGGRVRISMNLDSEVIGNRILGKLSTSLMMNSAEIEVTRE